MIAAAKRPQRIWLVAAATLLEGISACVSEEPCVPGVAVAGFWTAGCHMTPDGSPIPQAGEDGGVAVDAPQAADSAPPPSYKMCTRRRSDEFLVAATGSPSDAWTAMAQRAAPTNRFEPNLLWTGQEVLVFGGWNYENVAVGPGGRYQPDRNQWRPMAPIPSTTASVNLSTAVWTGCEMIVWGANTKLDGSGGGIYDPETDEWREISHVGEPSPRIASSAVWTGREMIVWGGSTGLCTGLTGSCSDGGRYDPASNTWMALSTVDAPAPRFAHRAIFTGTEMIVWAGRNSNRLSEPPVGGGGIYSVREDRWRPMTAAGEPALRDYPSVVWTGKEMIVWGGLVQGGHLVRNDGGRYDPVANRWTGMSIPGDLPGRYYHVAVWTGQEMIIWGGDYRDPRGFRYDPVRDQWTQMSTYGAPPPRAWAGVVFTGQEVVIWGGTALAGGRYQP